MRLDRTMTLQSDNHSYGMTALRSLTEVLIKELDPRETDRVLDVGTGSGRLWSPRCTSHLAAETMVAATPVHL